jgi:hypothetical protein
MKVNYAYKNGDDFETWGAENMRFLDKNRIKVFGKIFAFVEVSGPYAVYKKDDAILKISQRDRLAATAEFKRRAQTRETRKAFPR